MDNERIDQIFEMLNNEQKADYLTQFNKIRKNLIVLFSILLSLFLITFPIFIIVNYIGESNIENRIFDVILLATFSYAPHIIVLSVFLITTVKQLKWSDEKKIKSQIERKSNKEEIEVKSEPTTEEINAIADLTNRFYFNYSSNNELREIINNNLNVNANILCIELFCVPFQKRTLTIKHYNSQHIFTNSSSTPEFRLPTIDLSPKTDYSAFINEMKVVEELNKFTLRGSFQELENIFTLLKRQNIIKTDINTNLKAEWIEKAEFKAFLFLFRCLKLQNIVKQVEIIKKNLSELSNKSDELSVRQISEVDELKSLMQGTPKQIITALYNSNRFEIEEILNWYLVIEYSKEPISTPYSNIFYSKNPEAKQIINDLKDKEKIDKLKNSKYNNRHRYSIGEIDNMDGARFEIFVAELFTYLGYDAENTKLSGDQGVDVVAKKGDKIIAIQVKHYNNQTVGNHAIMEVVAGAKMHNATLCYVVTNNYFTRSAKELAAQNNVILWDRDRLIEKLSEI